MKFENESSYTLKKWEHNISAMVIWPLVSINSVASCEYAREEGKWYLADTNLHEDSQSEYLCDLADVEDKNLVN